jgi:alpha-tubulin suppressor-like RCC1 family protein
MNGLYVSGHNTHGQRGDSGEVMYTQFTLVSNTPFDFRNVMEIDCAIETSYFLTKDRKIYAAGSNEFGHRGTGFENVRTTTPQLVTAFGSMTIKQMISNRNALFIIDVNNMLWGVGKNVPGTDGSPQYTAVQCSTISVKTIYTRPYSEDVHMIATDGTVYFSGTKWASFAVDSGYILSTNGSEYYKWYRSFIKVDSFLDENENKGTISLNGQISTIFATNLVTFYST